MGAGVVRVGNEFLANSTTLGGQQSPAVARLANGGFVVAWWDAALAQRPSAAWTIRAQIFDAAGARIESEFQVNTTSVAVLPSVTALAGGNFVVTWTSADGAAVRGQVFSPTGEKIGGEFRASPDSQGPVQSSLVSSLANGGFLVSWSDGGGMPGDTNGYYLKAQRFDASGTKAGSVIVIDNEHPGYQHFQSEQTIVGLASGGFLAVWLDMVGIQARFFGADGIAVGNAFAPVPPSSGVNLSNDSPAMGGLPGGGFVIAWRTGSGVNHDIRAQIYDASGTKVGAELPVNTTTVGDQSDPGVSVLADGRFVISWRDESGLGGDSQGGAIKAQLFDSSGARIGSEFFVNATTAGSQFLQAGAGLDDGGVIVVWSDGSGLGGDDSGTGVKGQVFDVVDIVALSPTRREGQDGETSFAFVVTSTGDATTQRTMSYVVSGAGANAASPADFAGNVFPGGTVVLAAGEKSTTITVTVRGDTLVEADENFTITLSTPSAGQMLVAPSATATILTDDASVSLAALSSVKAEGASGVTAFTFTATRTGDTSIAHSVSYAVAGTGAAAASAADFDGGVLPAGTLTFAPGETTKTVSVAVAGDTLVELDEFFVVTLSAPSAGLALGVASAVGDIQNDDRSLISIVPLSAVKLEGDSGTAAFTFTVSLDQPSTFAQTAAWSVSGSGSNPANGDDFGGVLPSGVVTFAAGETSRIITIPVTGDAPAEFNEAFTVTLSDLSAGLAAGTLSAVGTILNDDAPAVSIVTATVTADENYAVLELFVFTVNLDRPSATVNSVSWAVVGSGQHPAAAVDFVGGLPSGTLVFAPGETSKTITVPVSDDTIVEFDEGFTLALSNPSPGLAIGAGLATGLIKDSDPSVVAITSVVSNPEGNAGTTLFSFTVSLDRVNIEDQSIRWSVAGIGPEAADAADFGGVLPSGVVSFAVGETSKVVTVAVSGDSVPEPTERFTVSLSDPSPRLLAGPLFAIGTILNDDGAAVVSLAALSATRAEGDVGTTSFTFTLTLAGDTSTARSVAWSVAGSGAHPVDAPDFGGTLPSGTLTFAVGEVSKSIAVTVFGDSTVELDEGFVVNLSNPSSGLTIDVGSAAGTIQNDDSAIAVAAHGDAYIVRQGQSLAATASVLSNDVGASTASLLVGTGHGTLQLAGNGSFSYTPAAGFSGIDSFTYHASAGASSDDAQALIYVVPVQAGGASTTLNLLALTAAEQIAATYTAFFGRAADAAGHGFWVGQFVQNLPSQGAAALFANIASSFGIGAEAKALYPFLVSPFTASDAQIGAFLDSVYNNLFNRSSDAAGLAYWTGQIKATLAANQFVGSVLVNIMSGAQDSAAGKDITTLMGKVAVSLAYVHEQQAHGTVWGAGDSAAATTLLDAVTDAPQSILMGIRNAETLIANHA